MKQLTVQQQELVDFAYRQSKIMGRALEVLLKFGVVCFEKNWEYRALLNHLQTNKNFGLVTGFEFNDVKQFIWLDTLSDPLRKQFRSNWLSRYQRN